jgi:hypothetical protein
MRKPSILKKLSWKFAFIIGAFVVIVAGTIAAYMQTRIITETDRHTDLGLEHLVLNISVQSDSAFLDASSAVEGLRRYVEANFDIGEYQMDAERYFDTNVTAPTVLVLYIT